MNKIDIQLLKYAQIQQNQPVVKLVSVNNFVKKYHLEDKYDEVSDSLKFLLDNYYIDGRPVDGSDMPTGVDDVHLTKKGEKALENTK